MAASLALRQGDSTHAVTAWVFAACASLGIPVAISAWRHHGDRQQFWASMAWLPMVWNLVAFVLALQLLPRPLADAIGESAKLFEGPLGDDHEGTKIIDALTANAAQHIAAEPTGVTMRTPTHGDLGRAEDRAIEIPFGEGGNGIFVDVVLEGSRKKLDRRYLFDTGASYTTITTALAQELGIDISEDAPTLEFNTAAGPRRSKMVYLPRLSIGGETIEGVLVSICDACATDRYPGLLGINVMREFYVDMDHRAQTMKLIPRIYEGPANRAYDIEPVVELSIEGRPELWLRHVRWKALVKNRGSVAISNVVPRVEFSNGTVLFGRRIARIEAGEVGESLVRGRAAKDARPSVEFTLSLAQAEW